MKNLSDLFSTYGLIGTLGVLFLLAAPFPITGINPFDLQAVAKLPSKQLLGLAFMGAGLILLVWRITERKSETTVSDADAHLLRETLLPPLNRQAIMEESERNEDLREQFAGITSARIELQKNQTRLSSTSLKSMIGVTIKLLKEIEEFSPWRPEADVKPDRPEKHKEQSHFDEWCQQRQRKGKPVPVEFNGTFYGPMLTLVQEMLRPVRIIKLELEHLT